jgi:spermidine synthase
MPQKPKVIFSVYSKINGFIKVVDTLSGRELKSDQDITITLADNHKYFNNRYWGIYVEELKNLRFSFKKALCFGLGGGSIQNKLFKTYPGIEILTIEIDPLMNDIHNYYFSGDKNDKHQILNLDAELFLKSHQRFGSFEETFDLIFVDVFSSMKVDEFDKVKNFYSTAKTLLRKNGIFSMNLIVKDEDQYLKSQENIKLLKEKFSDVRLVYTSDLTGIANLEVFASDKITL